MPHVLVRFAAKFLPIVGANIEKQISVNLVEFAPCRGDPTKATLTAIPSLVIYRSHAIPPRAGKNDANALVFKESLELERVRRKRKYKLAVYNGHLRVWGVWFSVPSFVQSRECGCPS